MLTDEERREVEAEIGHLPYRQAASISALKVVQKHRGWVSDEALGALAEVLGMSAAELDGVATFYNLIYRRPVGRHVILLCDSVSCWLCGCEGIRAHLRDKLGIDYGETTRDGRFTLLPMACLGTCDRAPALMLGEELHRDLTPERVDTILEDAP
jgi:NADH-quinone oxidoreductase subunit E